MSFRAEFSEHVLALGDTLLHGLKKEIVQSIYDLNLKIVKKLEELFAKISGIIRGLYTCVLLDSCTSSTSLIILFFQACLEGIPRGRRKE